ncbi:MAG: NAD(+) synthase [Planctomycetota bacterium]|jgi:NAD+ synthase (glutamine-hydrolysing)
MHFLDFLRITAASTPTRVADPAANRMAMERALGQLSDSDIVVFGELGLSGYTCGELFLQRTLLDACLHELTLLAQSVGQQMVVVGLPLDVQGRLFNVAAVLCHGQILGLVPKLHLPTYGEFYEGRWFHSGRDLEQSQLDLPEYGSVPVGSQLLFTCGLATIGVEICEDLWVPNPPSSAHAVAGANVLLNLSASNETIGKAAYRKQLVAMQSGRCLSAYAYASSGPTESTTDLVFGGHCLIAENGSVLAQSQRVGTGLCLKPTSHVDGLSSFASADVDLERLQHDRRMMQTMHQIADRTENASAYRRIPFELAVSSKPLNRWVDPHPFVPQSTTELEQRCSDVFEIQCASLAKRVARVPDSMPLTIGVSGGLDSTLALLVAVKMCDMLAWDRKRIVGLTMPGFGTTSRTKSNAEALMRLLGIRSECIDIRASCLRTFQSLGHKPFGVDTEPYDIDSLQKVLEKLPADRRNDLVFENVQARMRTLLLMSRGFVLGTGDMSELALGWCTYNADHMSMYNVNCSVPKTMVRFLVKYVAEHFADGELRKILLQIVDTPITPELLPLGSDQSIQQETEGTIGPYELHDFFLYHFVRGGASPQKILLLASHASFDRPYTRQEIAETLKTFIRRFFSAQFKRSCVPDGPKIGTVSLSPRGDWRMPSDAECEAWIADLDKAISRAAH